MTGDEDILAALRGVIDPELGINIVDLGLVYRATWTPTGIEVALTMTSRFCPFEDLLVQVAKESLHARFAEAASIRVDLVWTPPWSLERLSEEARRQLGWSNAPRRPKSINS